MLGSKDALGGLTSLGGHKDSSKLPIPGRKSQLLCSVLKMAVLWISESWMPRQWLHLALFKKKKEKVYLIFVSL